MQCTREACNTGLHAWEDVTCQEMYGAEEGSEEERAAHVQVCEGAALEPVQEDCYGALEDALQVYAQLCTGHSRTDSVPADEGIVTPESCYWC